MNSIEIPFTHGKLRKWRVEEAERMAKYANNKKIATNLRDGFPHPYNTENALQFLDLVEKSGNYIFAIEVNGLPWGSIGVHKKTDVDRLNGELGYWLAEEMWGKGIITETVEAIVNYVFENTPIIRIYADVYSKNPTSMRVLEKAGFVLEGILKQAVIKDEEILNAHVYARYKSLNS